LLNTRCTAPCSSTICAAHASTAARSATSSTVELTLPPRPSQRRTVSARPSPSTSARAIWHPSRASSMARDRPIPDAAPVMAAIRPRKSFMWRLRSFDDAVQAVIPSRDDGFIAWDGIGEHHGVLVDAGALHRTVVPQIALMDLPREAGTRLRKAVGRSVDVAGIESEQRLFFDVVVGVAGRGLPQADLAH